MVELRQERLDVGRAVAGGDEVVVRDIRQAADVQDDDVLGLLAQQCFPGFAG
jgi:hypothetical protein